MNEYFPVNTKESHQSDPRSEEAEASVPTSLDEYRTNRRIREDLKDGIMGDYEEIGLDTEDFSDISDIVTVDSNNRGHHKKGEEISGRKAGQFLSDHQMGLIQEHQDKIRNNSPRDVEPGVDDPIDAEDPLTRVLDPAAPPQENNGGDSGEDTGDNTEETLARMETNLTLAEHEYAKRTAKSRKSYLGRFCKGKTRLGRAILKIPVVGKVVEGVNNSFDTKTQQAKEEYESQFNQIGARIAEGLRELGYNEDEVKSLAATGVILRSHSLNHKIMVERKMQSKDTNKFVNWWVRSNGIKGKVAKVAVVGVAGLLAGATAGAILPAYTGLLAGGAAGGGIAGHVTRRRANSVNAEGRTLSSIQAEQDQNKSHQFAYEGWHDGEFARVEDITDRVEYRTDDEMLGNRRRMKAAVAVGKIAGGISGVLVHDLVNKPTTSANAAPQPSPKPKPSPKPTPEAPTVPKPPVDLNPTDNRLPWTHVTERLGNGNGTPDIFKAVDRGRSMGIDIIGEGRGLRSVTSNGVTYTDNAHINAALDYIMDH